MSRRNRLSSTSEAQYFFLQTLSGGAGSFGPIPANLGTSIQSVSDGYDLFRIRALKFRIFALTGGAAAACISSVPNTVPTASRTQLMEILESVDHEGPAQTVWSEWVHVRPPTFSGPFPWYHTRTGTFDVTEYQPCTIYFAGTGTNTVQVQIRVVYDFRDPIPTVSTPMEIAMRKELLLLRSEQSRQQLKEKMLRGLLERGCVWGFLPTHLHAGQWQNVKRLHTEVGRPWIGKTIVTI